MSGTVEIRAEGKEADVDRLARSVSHLDRRGMIIVQRAGLSVGSTT